MPAEASGALGCAGDERELRIAIGAIERLEFAIEAARDRSERGLGGFVVSRAAVGAFEGAVHAFTLLTQ